MQGLASYGPGAKWKAGGVPPAARTRTLYVSDLDGTLLRADGTLSETSARLLSEAIEAGALVTYATARSFLRARQATAGLRLKLPVITYGGTATADPATGAYTDLRLLDQAVVEAALSLCAVHPSAEPVLFTWQEGRDWVRWRPERMTAGLRAFLEERSGDPRLRPVTADDPLNAAAVFYVAILAENQVLTGMRGELLPDLDGAAHFISTDPGTPGLDWLEFHHADGTKAAAIRRLAASLQADRLVVFGDNSNDVPMFEVADESYAVSAAAPAVRAAATGVIGSNDEDAVALWITEDLRREGGPEVARRRDDEDPAAHKVTGMPAPRNDPPADRPRVRRQDAVADKSSEDTDAAWGDYREAQDDDTARLLGDRPPHWDNY